MMVWIQTHLDNWTGFGKTCLRDENKANLLSSSGVLGCTFTLYARGRDLRTAASASVNTRWFSSLRNNKNNSWAEFQLWAVVWNVVITAVIIVTDRKWTTHCRRDAAEKERGRWWQESRPKEERKDNRGKKWCKLRLDLTGISFCRTKHLDWKTRKVPNSKSSSNKWTTKFAKEIIPKRFVFLSFETIKLMIVDLESRRIESIDEKRGTKERVGSIQSAVPAGSHPESGERRRSEISVVRLFQIWPVHQRGQM